MPRVVRASMTAAYDTWPTPHAQQLSMKTIKTYPTRVEGVQLLVPDDRVEAALTLLAEA